MAKKSNKTEHVLKLIVKNEEEDQDDLFGMPQELAGSNSAAAVSTQDEPPKADKTKKRAEKSSEPSSVEVIDKKTVKSEEQKKTIKGTERKLEKESERKLEKEPVEKPEAEAAKNIETESARALQAGADKNLEKSGLLVNLAEVLVKEKAPVVMERMKVCTCQTCVNNVLALALNTLPPKYVTDDAGRQQFRLEAYKMAYETDILAALTKACVRVKASPRHEKE